MGAAIGGGEAGKAEKASEHSHLIQCGPICPRVRARDGGRLLSMVQKSGTFLNLVLGETGT